MSQPTRLQFRIQQLSQLAGRAFEVLAIGQHSARVRQVPDVRTIRYYTTLGLLDRPAAMEGRTAWYGPRHLTQLIAIKRLQSTGLPLVRIQEQLAGADDDLLTRTAELPQDFPAQLANWMRELDANAVSSNDATSDRISQSTGQADATDSGYTARTKAKTHSLVPAERHATDTGEIENRHAAFWQQPVTAAEAHRDENLAGLFEAARSASVIPLTENISLLLDGIDLQQFDADSLAVLQPALDSLQQALRSLTSSQESDS